MLSRHDRRIAYAQNFLRQPQLVDRLLDRSEIGCDDLVVEVVLLRLRQRETPLVAAQDAALFRDFATYAFTAWQPTVRDALTRILPRRVVTAVERESGVALDRPPSAILFPQWVTLAVACLDIAGARLEAVEGARARLERQQSQLQKVHRARGARPPRAS